MNKRSTMTVGLLLALVYLAGTFVVGILIEARLALGIKQLSADMPYVTVVDQHYRRGWFTSDQDLTLAFSASPGLRVGVHSVIHHGPVCGLACIGMAGADSQLAWGEPLKSALVQVFGADEPLRIHSRLGFFGGGGATLSSPAIHDVTLNGGGRLSSDGVRLTLDYTRNADSMQTRGSLPHLSFLGSGNARVELTGATLSTQSRRVRPLLYAGDVGFAVRHLAVSGPLGADPRTLDDVEYTVQSTTDAGFLNMSIHFRTGALDSSTVKLKAAHWDMTLRHLNMDALESLNRRMREFNQQAGRTVTADPGSLLAALKGPAAELLLQKPEIQLERVGFTSQGGEAVLSGVIGLRDVVAADVAENADVNALLTKVAANLDFSLDDAALAALPGAGSGAAAKLQSLAQQGFVAHDGGRWHTNMRYEGGRLTLNGKSFAVGGTAAAPALDSGGPGLPRRPASPLP